MQMILVNARGNRAWVSLYETNERGRWFPIVKTQGYIGKDGLGKTKEGDRKTPRGIFNLGNAFGIQENPRNRITIHKIEFEHVLDR